MILIEFALGWPAPPKAQIAIMFACGATPNRRTWDAIAPAMPVPCASGEDAPQPASNRAADRAGEIGLVGVDFRIDHRNDGIVALGDPVRVGEMEFFHDILCRIAQIDIGIVLILGQAQKCNWAAPRH